MTDRTKELLNGIAARLENLSFVDGGFLQEYDVSSREVDVLSLAGQLLKGVLALPESEQTRIVLLGLGFENQLAQDVFESMRMGEVQKELRATLR